MMLTHYEAPPRFTLEGFVDPAPLTRAIRVVAPPNARSTHALAGSICRSLGAVNDRYTKSSGSTLVLSSAAAKSLADNVTDLYIAAAEDLTRPAIYECIEFAGLIGVNLHLVFSHGQVHTHSDTLNEIGSQHAPFSSLPPPLIQPGESRPDTSPTPEERNPREDMTTLPDDHWMTFRAAYHATLPAPMVEECDAIYLDAYATARTSDARTAEEIAALIGSLWQRLGIADHQRLVTCRAVQAACFRHGLITRIDMHHFTRHVQLNYVNLMTAEQYTMLRQYLHPWRAAAAVLHAHHVSTEQSLALRAHDVTIDGHIPSLDINLLPEARTLLAAQRWHQLITQEADPPLLNGNVNKVRQGIRIVVQELNLPLIPYWRSLTKDKGRSNMGIKVEAYR